MSLEVLKSNSLANRRKYLAEPLEGCVGYFLPSLKSAKELNLDPSTIRKNIKGKVKLHKGFIFKEI